MFISKQEVGVYQKNSRQLFITLLEGQRTSTSGKQQPDTETKFFLLLNRIKEFLVVLKILNLHKSEVSIATCFSVSIDISGVNLACLTTLSYTNSKWVKENSAKTNTFLFPMTFRFNFKLVNTIIHIGGTSKYYHNKQI